MCILVSLASGFVQDVEDILAMIMSLPTLCTNSR